MRYFIEFSYDGSVFAGYQRQPQAPSVQAVLEEKLSLIAGEKIEVVGSSRTDAGVHAKHQVAHFDTNKKFTENWIFRLNKMLPSAVVIYSIYPVSEDKHARFDAVSRIYEYHIIQKKNPFLTNYAYLYSKELDFEAMNEAAATLLEYEDFESFSKVHTDVFTFKCTIKQAYWTRKEDFHWVFTIESNRFLRGMVRAIVGTLLWVGEGKIRSEDIKEIIEAKNRQKAGRAVPPEGLFLTKVNY